MERAILFLSNTRGNLHCHTLTPADW